MKKKNPWPTVQLLSVSGTFSTFHFKTITSKVTWGVQTSASQTCIPHFHFFIIGFLPLTLFWLLNTKHCCKQEISLYFSHFPPFSTPTSHLYLSCLPYPSPHYFRWLLLLGRPPSIFFLNLVAWVSSATTSDFVTSARPASHMHKKPQARKKINGMQTVGCKDRSINLKMFS